MNIITIGIDLAKNVFAVHGVNENGKAELVKPKVPRDQFCLAAFIHAVDCKNILGKINSNGDIVHDFPPGGFDEKTLSIMALLMPYAVTSPLLRNGEVPFIR